MIVRTVPFRDYTAVNVAEGWSVEVTIRLNSNGSQEDAEALSKRIEAAIEPIVAAEPKVEQS